jgi:hypothetical protein
MRPQEGYQPRSNPVKTASFSGHGVQTDSEDAPLAAGCGRASTAGREYALGRPSALSLFARLRENAWRHKKPVGNKPHVAGAIFCDNRLIWRINKRVIAKGFCCEECCFICATSQVPTTGGL